MRAPTSLRYPLETATTSSRAFKSELHALEARMGELAVLLSEMADALVAGSPKSAAVMIADSAFEYSADWPNSL